MLESIVAPPNTPEHPHTKPKPEKLDQRKRREGKQKAQRTSIRQPSTAKARRQCLNKTAALKQTLAKEIGLPPEDRI
ncbi:hypothetical protein NDU88_003401 [Pleurodeles waltl]|uniref:Uncharacterized protein n=1 Tax=Pleurodeles waltl TaxID=8319 RepID=A0AAV7RGN7_PLEWA|nr:hypothetical protein NDU88_003401 [Pleurodeles waltl]